MWLAGCLHVKLVLVCFDYNSVKFEVYIDSDFQQWCLSYTGNKQFFKINDFFFFFVFLLFLGPLPRGIWRFPGQGSNQSCSLCQSHSNAGSEPCLQPTPQLTATPDPQSTEQGQGPNPATSWFLVGFVNHCARKGTPRQCWILNSLCEARART